MTDTEAIANTVRHYLDEHGSCHTIIEGNVLVLHAKREI